MRFSSLTLALALSSLWLTGCGSMRSYHNETQGAISAAGSGQLDSALATLEANNKGDDKDLLYFFEKGQFLHLKNDIPASTASWLSADEKIHIWEEDVKTNSSKVLGHVGSVLVNDKTRLYEGYDYEKVMLSTFLAVNHALSNDWEKARTEIKKTHEREAIIADLRTKEYEKVEEDAKKKDVKTTYKDLKGYPVETLDDPEVISLKNGYQSAFSHYLAGFIYEALREPSLAAPGYRKAIELKPNVKILEDGLKEVDSRSRKLKPNETDVLFIVSSGAAPARESRAIPIPIPINGHLNYTQFSFPVLNSDKTAVIPSELSLGERSIPVSLITNIDAMSRRTLRDDMPGIILRTTIRGIAKGLAQNEIQKQTGLLGGLVASVGIALTEQADERVWRTLPAQISLGRAILPAGKHTVRVKTASGPQQFEITVGGKHEIVPIRLLGSTTYLAQATVPPQTQVALEQSTPAAATPAPEADKTKKVVKKTKKSK